MMLWWLAVALAADDVQAQLHALTAQKHACDDEIPALDARLALAPTDDTLLLRRADCRYQIGRLAWALEDVESIAVPTVDSRVLEAILLTRAGQVRGAEKLTRGLPADGPARGRVDASVLLAKGRAGEAWGVVDQLLNRWPTDPDTLRAVGELAALDPSGVTTAARAALARPTLFGEAYNRGINRLNAQDGAGCAAHVAEAEALAGPVEAPVLARLGHQCAALAGELEQASRWLAQTGGVPFADPMAVLRQAELMRRVGQAEEALLLFEAVAPVTLEQERLRDTARVTIHTTAGRLDEGLVVASAAQASGASRANLAVALRKAGRGEEAMTLLMAACEDMSGDDAVRCYQTVARWKG